jgi:hypothetical protein
VEDGALKAQQALRNFDAVTGGGFQKRGDNPVVYEVAAGPACPLLAFSDLLEVLVSVLAEPIYEREAADIVAAPSPPGVIPVALI